MLAINNQVPEDMVISIAQYLDTLKDKATLSATCKDFYKVIESAWLNESKATLQDFSIQNWTNLQIKQVAFAFNPLSEEIMCHLAKNDHKFQDWPFKYLLRIPSITSEWNYDMCRRISFSKGYLYSQEHVIDFRSLIKNHYFPADRPLTTKTIEKLVDIGVDKLGLSEDTVRPCVAGLLCALTAAIIELVLLYYVGYFS